MNELASLCRDRKGYQTYEDKIIEHLKKLLNAFVASDDNLDTLDFCTIKSSSNNRNDYKLRKDHAESDPD